MKNCKPSRTTMEVGLNLSKDDKIEAVNEMMYHQLGGI
jgi:hypothetical protein